MPVNMPISMLKRESKLLDSDSTVVDNLTLKARQVGVATFKQDVLGRFGLAKALLVDGSNAMQANLNLNGMRLTTVRSGHLNEPNPDHWTRHSVITVRFVNDFLGVLQKISKAITKGGLFKYKVEADSTLPFRSFSDGIDRSKFTWQDASVKLVRSGQEVTKPVKVWTTLGCGVNIGQVGSPIVATRWGVALVDISSFKGDFFLCWLLVDSTEKACFAFLNTSSQGRYWWTTEEVAGLSVDALPGDSGQSYINVKVGVPFGDTFGGKQGESWGITGWRKT